MLDTKSRPFTSKASLDWCGLGPPFDGKLEHGELQLADKTVPVLPIIHFKVVYTYFKDGFLGFV